MSAFRERFDAETRRRHVGEERIDKLESIRDEQRGAWRLALVLIGGNLIATALLLLAAIAPTLARAV